MRKEKSLIKQKVEIYEKLRQELIDSLQEISDKNIDNVEEFEPVLKEIIDKIKKSEEEIVRMVKEKEVKNFTIQDEFYLKLLKEVKKRRRQAQLTIEDIAKEIKISPTTYRNFEKGRGNINLVIFFKILDFLKIKLDLIND